MNSVKRAPENFAKAVVDQMEKYTEEKREQLFQKIDDITDKAKKAVADHAPVDSGAYKKAIRAKKPYYKSAYNQKNVVYVAGKHYRLTHLLENGHLTANGTKRVKARPHMIYGQELAERELPKAVKEVFEE